MNTAASDLLWLIEHQSRMIRRLLHTPPDYADLRRVRTAIDRQCVIAINSPLPDEIVNLLLEANQRILDVLDEHLRQH